VGELTDRDERRLVRRLKARDERAFRELVETHQHRVFNLVLRMLGNREEAEDVSQEVFVTVFKAIGTFREESRLSTWLYRISANHAKNRIKYLARRRTARQDALDEVPEGDLHRHAGEPVPGPDHLAQGREMEALLQRGLQALDEEHRLIIVLRDVEDLSYEEIVEITGMPLGTVKSRLHRARSALRQAVARLETKRGGT
jgi:RNA polymerase sigma-70 factor (ECF subfamily)